MSEKWVRVDLAPRYIVSDAGRLRHSRVGAPILKCRADRYGYLCTRLEGKCVKVHRIVCEAFHGACPPGHECAHLNSDKLDNRSENLAWVTRSENQQHNIARGVRRHSASPGEDHHAAKLTAEQVTQIRLAVESGASQRSVARQFGISQTQVCHIAQGKAWAKAITHD